MRIYQPIQKIPSKVYLSQPIGSACALVSLVENTYTLITSDSLLGSPTIFVPQYVADALSPIYLNNAHDQITFIEDGQYLIEMSMSVSLATDVDSSAQVSFSLYNVLGNDVINLGQNSLVATYYDNISNLPSTTLSASTIITLEKDFIMGLCYNVNTLDYQTPLNISFSSLSLMIEKM